MKAGLVFDSSGREAGPELQGGIDPDSEGVALSLGGSGVAAGKSQRSNLEGGSSLGLVLKEYDFDFFCDLLREPDADDGAAALSGDGARAAISLTASRILASSSCASSEESRIPTTR